MRILLVEDSPTDSLLVTAMLRKEYGEALELFQANSVSGVGAAPVDAPYDVALVDLFLPDCEGFNTFTRLQKLLGTVPIVLLTSSDDAQLAQEAVRAGAQDYLLKNEVDSRALRRSLTYAMERQRLVHQLRERVKEMTALHESSRLLQDPDLEAQTVMERVAALLPPAFQYPEYTCARLRFGGLDARSPGCDGVSAWRLEERFTAANGEEGVLEV